MSSRPKWKQILNDYRVLAFNPGIDEALQAFMAKRKEVLPYNVS